MTNKEAVKILKSSMLMHSYRYSAEELEEAFNLAIKALHTVEIINEELSPAYEDIAIWFDVPHFEEIQERAEKRAIREEKEDD